MPFTTNLSSTTSFFAANDNSPEHIYSKTYGSNFSPCQHFRLFFFFQFFQIFHFIPPTLILSMHVPVFMVIERVKLSCQDDDGELWTIFFLRTFPFSQQLESTFFLKSIKRDPINSTHAFCNRRPSSISKQKKSETEETSFFLLVN